MTKEERMTFKRRRQDLAALLRRIQPEKFAMELFVKGCIDGSKLGECGTAACVGGWCTQLPEAHALGYRLKHSYLYHNEQPVSFELSMGRVFLGLSKDEIYKLFYNNMGATAEEKAIELDKLAEALDV